MDVVTHGLLGALAGQAISQRQHIQVAGIVGAFAALLPDLDVLIRSSDDVLLTLTYHRHFSHSLVFAPLGALLASLALWPFVRKKISAKQTYLYSLIGYLSACLLDVCTSYGTHLFWPLTDQPVSLGIIAVVDPLFSVAICVAGIAAMWSGKRYCSWIGLGLAGCYLLLGAVQHERAYKLAESVMLDNGIEPSRIIIKPTLGNLLLWRAITVTEETARADAVRVGLFEPPKIYPGPTIHLIDPSTWKSLPLDSRAHRDLNRFYKLADQMLVAHPQRENFVGDLRYAMLPDSVEPIWGIRVDPANPDAQPEFVVERTFTPAMREKLMMMLKGD